MIRKSYCLALATLLASMASFAPVLAKEASPSQQNNGSLAEDDIQVAERLLVAGDIDEAERRFRAVVAKRNLLYSAGCIGVSRCLAERGAFAEARPWLRTGIQLHFDLCGFAHQTKRENYENIDAVWKVAASGKLGRLRALAKEPAPAKKEVDEAHERRIERSWEASLLLGEILARRGDVENARRYLRHATQATGWCLYYQISELAQARLERLDKERSTSSE